MIPHSPEKRQVMKKTMKRSRKTWEKILSIIIKLNADTLIYC